MNKLFNLISSKVFKNNFMKKILYLLLACLSLKCTTKEPAVYSFSETHTIRTNYDITVNGFDEYSLAQLVINQDGKEKTILVNEDEFMASKTNLGWANEKFIYCSYSCGAPCWGAKIYATDPANEKNEDLLFPIEIDSVLNLVIYPNNDNTEQLFIKNFETQKELTIDYFPNKESNPSVSAITEHTINQEEKTYYMKWETLHKNQIIIKDTLVSLLPLF